MLINLGDEGPNYEWLEDWADVPEPAQAQAGWAHHGLAVTRSGEIVGFHPARAEVVIFDRAGHVSSSWPVGLKEGHGITLVEDDGDERLWLADPGTKMRKAPDNSYQRDVAPGQGQVVKFGLDGTQVVTPGPPVARAPTKRVSLRPRRLPSTRPATAGTATSGWPTGTEKASSTATAPTVGT